MRSGPAAEFWNPTGPDGLPAAGERGGGQAEEHWDCREVMHHAGAAGLGERAGCSWRVAADRVGSENGCADEAGTGCADQGPSRPAAGRGISGVPQADGVGQDQRPGHGEVRGLDPAAWPAARDYRGRQTVLAGCRPLGPPPVSTSRDCLCQATMPRRPSSCGSAFTMRRTRLGGRSLTREPL